MPARIVDISEGGLCLFSPVPLTARSEIEIVIDVPSYQDATVRGQVWHVSRQQIRGTKRKVWAIGLMLESSDAAYQQLLAAAGVAPDRPAAEGDEESGASGEALMGAAPADGTDTAGDRATRIAGANDPGPRAAPPGPDEGPPLGDPLPPIFDRLEPQVFRVRIKTRGGPRTRLLTLTAESADEARALAERDLESPWRVIEVRAA